MLSVVFLEVLPKIATSPLAITAYCFFIVAFFWFRYQKVRAKSLVKTLEALPKDQRKAFAEKTGFNHTEVFSLPAKDRSKYFDKKFALLRYSLTLAFSFFAFTLLVFAWLQHFPNSTSYFIRVNTLDTLGNAMNSVEVISSIGGEPQKIRGGVQFCIPSDAVPKSREVIFRAKSVSGFESGSITHRLTEQQQQSVNLY